MKSLQQQLRFIIDNERTLNRELRIVILTKIIIEYENEEEKPFWTSSTDEPLIDLNKVAERNVDLINQIYNIVYTRREEINKPLN